MRLKKVTRMVVSVVLEAIPAPWLPLALFLAF